MGDLWKQAARHECGHWLVGLLVGFEPGRIRRWGAQAGAEVQIDRATPTTEEARKYCEDRLKQLVAGGAAEYVSAVGEFADEVGGNAFFSEPPEPRFASDVGRARELACVLANMLGEPSPALRANVLSHAWNRSGEMLQAEVKKLNALTARVERLKEDEEVSADELRKVIRA